MLSQLVHTLGTPSSRPRHALVTRRDGISLKCHIIICLNCSALHVLLTTATDRLPRHPRPPRAGKHTPAAKSSSFKLKSNENLFRQAPSFCNAKKGLLPGFKMRYLPRSYSQNWRFKLKMNQGNNFRALFNRSPPKLGRLWEPIERKFA